MYKGQKALKVNLAAIFLELGTPEELEITKGLELGTTTKGVEEGKDDT
jgi:hypothetical protein